MDIVELETALGLKLKYINGIYIVTEFKKQYLECLLTLDINTLELYNSYKKRFKTYSHQDIIVHMLSVINKDTNTYDYKLNIKNPIIINILNIYNINMRKKKLEKLFKNNG